MYGTACIGGEDAARGGPPVGCGGVRHASLLRGTTKRDAAQAGSDGRRTFLDLTVSTLLERPRKGQTRRRVPAREPGHERGGRVLERCGVGARSRTRHGATATREGVPGARFQGGKPRRATGVCHRQRRQTQRTLAGSKALKSREARGTGTHLETTRRQRPAGDGRVRRCGWGKLWRAYAPEGKSRNQQVSGVVAETR